MRKRRSTYRQLARYSGVIFVLPSSLLVGYFLGFLLDGYLESSPWLSITFLFLGAAAGFVQLFRVLNRKP
jgi:ATP synthase protein I